MRWLIRWWRRDRLEHDLDAELRYDVERRVQDFIDRGMSAAEAGRLVNQRLARLYFPDADPVGKRIRVAASATKLPAAASLTIVGVVPDLRQNPSIVVDPIVYLPFEASSPLRGAAVIRTAGDPAAMAPLVRAEVRAIDPDLAIAELQTMAQTERAAGWNARIASDIISTIALIAVLLSAVGLYAVTAFGVAQRTREISIRFVLGAGRRQVMWLVLQGAIVQVGLGVLAGLALKAVWSHAFAASPSATINPNDLVLVVFVMAMLTLAASAAPVFRASRVDPLPALRSE